VRIDADKFHAHTPRMSKSFPTNQSLFGRRIKSEKQSMSLFCSKTDLVTESDVEQKLIYPLLSSPQWPPTPSPAVRPILTILNG
jgi:hypothetical protein